MGLGAGLGLTVMSFLSERKMDHPVANEIIRIAERNVDIQEIIGYPVEKGSSLHNKAQAGEKAAYFFFPLKGPKGKLQVSVEAEAFTLAEI